MRAPAANALSRSFVKRLTGKENADQFQGRLFATSLTDLEAVRFGVRKSQMTAAGRFSTSSALVPSSA
jgi:hypothetical protein